MAEKFSLTAQLNLQAPKNVKQVLNSIKSQIKSPTIDLKVSGARTAAKEVKQVASATKDLAREAKTAGSNAGSMAKLFGSALKNVLRYDIARRVFYAFAGAVEQGVKDAVAFEREMIKISQVSGKTMQQLKGLQKTVTDLATSLGVSSGSLIKVGLILKQTGLSVKDTEFAMRALAKTELAPTFDNIADTAETAVAAMRQFSLEAKDLESLLGKINIVAGSFAVEASDIGVAIRRTGGAFKAAGGNVEELIALFTSVRSTTRETAETIATGFRTIFTRLQRPTTIKFLRQFGVELTDLNGKFVGPYEGVRRLNNALQNLDPKDLRFSAIVEQLGGFRQVSKVIPLIQEFKVTQAALNAQLRAGESLTTDAQTAQQSLAVQMQKVTEDVKELFREMAASDSFVVFAKGALALANAMTAVGKAIAPIIPILTALFAIKAGGFIGGALKKGGLGGLNKAFGRADGRTGGADLFGGGGKVRGFNRGGWVPGSGSGDTVPAMLQPGEFVIRKSAAQAMGSSLNSINKYARGGPVLASAKYKSTHDGDSYKIARSDASKPYDSSTRLKGVDAAEIPSAANLQAWIKKTGKTKAQHPGYIAKQIALTHRRGRGGKTFNNAFFDNDGDPIGNDTFGRPLFEDAKLRAKLLSAAPKGDVALPMVGNKVQGEKKFAKGGSVGTDTVPALLTPGEFVVNKKSAQAIGYDNLGAMNKYNLGGIVGAAGKGAAGAQSGLIDAVILTSIITSISSFAEQSGLLSESMGKLVSEFGGTLAQVKGINAGLAEVFDSAKDNKEFGLFQGKNAKTLRANVESQSKAKAELDKFKESLKSSNEGLDAALGARLEPGVDTFGNEELIKAQKVAEKKVRADETAVKQSEARLKKQDQQIAADNKAIKKSKILTLGLEIAGAAAIQFGNSMKDAALKAIEAGDFEGRSAQAAAGGGLAGAAQGALIGGQSGIKKGGIYGLLIGAIAGATMAFVDAEQRIKEVKFAQTLEAGKRDLELFQKQTISATEGLQNLERQINKRKEIGGDPASAAKARLAQEAAAETFITGLGKNVASVDEFNAVISKNSKTLRATGTVQDKLINKIRDEVESRIDSEEKLRAYTEAQREATNELLRLKGISAIAGELKSNIKTVNDVVSGVGTSGIGPIGRAGAAFENTPRSQQGIKRFEEAIDRIGESGKDAGLGEFAGRVKAGAAVERNLDEVLQRAKTFNPVGKESVEQAIIDDIKDSIGPAAAAAVEDDISKALNKIDIVNLEDQEDEIAEAIKGTLVATQDTFIEFASLIDERNAFLKNSYAQLEGIENSYIAAIGAARKARVKEEQNFLKNINVSALGPESNKDVQARFFTRLEELAKPGRGIKGTDTPVNDIRALGARLSQIQKEQIANNKLLAQPNNANLEAQKALIDGSRELNREFKVIQSILKEYGNSQQRLVVLNEKLARAKQQEETLKGAADKIIFGTADDANQSAKFVNSISKALNEGTVMGIAPELRLAVVEAFKSGQFGQQGEDILNRDREAALKKFGIQPSGVLGRASKDVRDTSDEIREIDKAAADALNELARVEGERVDVMASTIESQNAQFLRDMRVLFHEERLKQAQIEQKAQEKKTDQLGTTRSMIKEGGIGPKEFAVLKSPEKMQELDTLRRLQGRKTQDLTAAGFSEKYNYEIEDFLDDYSMASFKGKGSMPTSATEKDEAGKFTTGAMAKEMDAAYQPALAAVRGVMDAAQLSSLQTKIQESWIQKTTTANYKWMRPAREATIEESGLSGENVIPNLMEYAGKNFSDTAALEFIKQIKVILTTDLQSNAKVAVQEIAKAMKTAQTKTGEKQDALEENTALVRLAKLDKSFTDELSTRVAGITSLNALVKEHEGAVTALGIINAKLKMIKGLDPLKGEKDAAAAKATSQRASIAQERQQLKQPTVSRSIERFDREGNPIAPTRAEQLAEIKERDAAARAERIKKAIDNQSTPQKDEAIQKLGPLPGQSTSGTFIQGQPRGGGAVEDVKTGISLIKYSLATADSSERQEEKLSEIVAAIKGDQEGAATEGGQKFYQIDTSMLDKSINTFSNSVADLERVMSGPLTMEVGGAIDINVNLSGAEVLQENEAAFAKIAGSKVADGINNFIRNGLRSSSIAIKGDWTA